MDNELINLLESLGFISAGNKRDYELKYKEDYYFVVILPDIELKNENYTKYNLSKVDSYIHDNDLTIQDIKNICNTNSIDELKDFLKKELIEPFRKMKIKNLQNRQRNFRIDFKDRF